MSCKTEAAQAPLMQMPVPGLSLVHQAARVSTAKQAAQATLLQQSTAGAARDALVLEKRRLEGIARALGLSRKTTAELVSAYFTNIPVVKP